MCINVCIYIYFIYRFKMSQNNRNVKSFENLEDNDLGFSNVFSCSENEQQPEEKLRFVSNLFCPC